MLSWWADLIVTLALYIVRRLDPMRYQQLEEIELVSWPSGEDETDE